MLLELGLENYVLVKEASLAFSPGLVILTGETGAGKSLLVQALKTVLGGRTGPHLIRTGTDQAVVQALFDDVPSLRGLLDGLGIPLDDGLAVRRVFSRNGRVKNYVNGAIVPLQDLKRITSSLVSIAGQHEYQELLLPESHRLALDRFAGIEADVAVISRRFRDLKALERELDEASSRRNALNEERERLMKEAADIDAVGPGPGEDDALEQERAVLKAATTLRALGEGVYGTLYGEKGSVIERLNACRADLSRMSALDSRLARTAEEMASAFYSLEESARTLREYLSGLVDDPSRLDAVEERIHALRDLMRRFGPTLDDVIAHRKSMGSLLENLLEKGEKCGELKKMIERQGEELVERARLVSGKRREAAKSLSEAVSSELSGLRLENADFIVEVTAPSNPVPADVGPAGMDAVRFLFRPNAGEPARPLASIASGGELSRVMLAIRSVLATRSGIETIVFDEIDAGIGGEVAGRVGAKLKALAASGQVIVITHFPQIASLANQHFTVSKHVTGGATRTIVTELPEGERTGEIARMLGGEPAAAFEYARTLVEGRKG